MIKATKTKRTIFFVFSDILIFLLSAYFAFLLRFSGDIPDIFISGMIKFAFIMLILELIFAYKSGLYKVPWRFFGLREARKMLINSALCALIFTGIFFIFYDFFEPFPRSVILIYALISLLLMGVFRISKRVLLDFRKPSTGEPCVIIGATNKTLQLLKGFASGYASYYPQYIVDPRKDSIGTTCGDFLVASMDELKKYPAEGITTAIISKKLSPRELDALHSELNEYGYKKIKLFSLLGDDVNIKDISIEDLLARKPKDLDSSVIKEFIGGKVVMITGAGGTIGSELSRLCLAFGAKQLVLVEHSEHNLYAINEALGANERCKLALVDVTQLESLERVFNRYRPQIVLHAAAYKHVPLCEFNPKEAVRNNILGTKNVVDLAKKYAALRMVLISTDKAVRPTNIMGASKRVCELYALNSGDERTDVVAVRFGNVLGSSGSVIPKFKAQIAANKPLSVTHPDITRYFMLVSEACQLVLQAASIARGGELFVLDMGKPVKIADLAQKMLLLSGKEELGIEYVGLRPGEKLYEELLVDENDKQTKFESIFVTHSEAVDVGILGGQIKNLLDAKPEQIVEILKEIVPEFNHNNKG